MNFQKVENKNKWDDLLGKTLFKTFFHSPAWENFLEKELFWLKFEHYLWRDKFLLSIARCRLLGKEKIVSHPLCEYGGPLPLEKNVDLEAFISDFRQFFGEKAKIKFHPYLFNSPRPPLTLRGGEISTFWVEDFSKKSKEDLWKNFRKTLRNALEEEENGAHIEECANREDLRAFYALYLATVRRHKNVPLLFSFFEFFYAHEFARIFLAKRCGKVVGGSIFLFYNPFIHYFINASDQKFRSTHIGHKILWHVMQGYVGSPTSHIEYDYFDLGGTRKGSNLEIFKRGWGAKEYPVHTIGGSAIRSTDSPYRSILGLIPPAFMKHFATLALWAKI